jgi:glucose/arabinose dehydrogenase
MVNLHLQRAPRRFYWLGAALLSALLGAFVSFATVEAQGITLPAGFNDTEVAYRMTYPTTMVVAPDGRVFFAQKNGVLRVIKNGAVLSTPFLQRSVSTERERGLFGIALDPNFATNQFVYIRYTTSGTCRHILERVTAQGDVEQSGSGVILVDFGPCQGVGSHNGGTMHFGLDGKLYTGIGEQGCCPNYSQSLSNVFGKLLRINRDGTIPTDNPFYNTTTGQSRMIWAYGLRNPFVFAIQPGTGQIMINDVGAMTWEEINVGRRGANYGWPVCEGVCNPPNASYQDPIFAYTHAEGCSITGGVFYNPTTAQFPASYTGKYFFTDWCGGWIRTLDVSSGNVTAFADGFRDALGQPVDLDLAPDGSLYWLVEGNGVNKSADSSLHRISVSNLPGISRNPRNLTVDAGATANFFVVASGNGPYSYQWQRNSVNIPGATASSLSFVATAGDNTARFRVIVSNNAGNVTSQQATLTVRSGSNTAPVPTITLPEAGAHYHAGDTIAFAGNATDSQDGTLPASAFMWEFVFHHANHTHDFIDPIAGVKSGTFDIPEVDELESNVWYRIYLTVTDSQGLSASTYRDILPWKSTITLQTDPPGLQLTVDGRLVTAPYSFVSVENQPRTIGAVTPQTTNGVTYAWQSWSDGGAATHEIVTPANDRTYTARFGQTGDVIFADSFEIGHLGNWSVRYTDNGDLSVKAGAALDGFWGMHAVIDDNTPISVVDETPGGEPRYRARFYFDPNSMPMTNGDNFVLFFGYSGNGMTRPVVNVELRFFNGGYQVRGGLIRDGLTWLRGGWIGITDAPHFVELDWRAASAAGMNNGSLTFWVDGGTPRTSITGVDNDTFRIDRARLGANAGIDAGTRGVMFFDGFVSRRTTYIGPSQSAQVAVAEGLVVDPAEMNAYTEEPEPAEYTEPLQAPDEGDPAVDLGPSFYLPYINR